MTPAGTDEFVEWRRVVQRDPCAYCGGRGGTKDHILPGCRFPRLLRDPSNITGACRSCNMAKGSLDLLGFLFERHWGVDLNQARLDDIMMGMVGMWMP